MALGPPIWPNQGLAPVLYMDQLNIESLAPGVEEPTVMTTPVSSSVHCTALALAVFIKLMDLLAVKAASPSRRLLYSYIVAVDHYR